MSDNWLKIAKYFSSYFTVHTIDLRNHGKSFHSNNMSLEDLSYDIFNYIKYYKLSNFFLLGHSLGGKVVMKFINKYLLNLPKKLIIVDIAPRAYSPSHDSIINALNTVNFNILTSRKEVEEHLKQYIFDSRIIKFLLKNISRIREQKLGFQFNLRAITNNYYQLIGKTYQNQTFTYPTLFLYGDKSDYILPQDKILISQQFKNVKFDSISNAGHWLHIDNPNEFIKKVKFFLDS